MNMKNCKKEDEKCNSVQNKSLYFCNLYFSFCFVIYHFMLYIYLFYFYRSKRKTLMTLS